MQNSKTQKRKRNLIAAMALIAAGAAGQGCISSQIEFRDGLLKEAEAEGMILADLHTHPRKNKSLEELLDVLSKGIVGLAAIDGWDSIFRYENARELPGFAEIDKDRLGKITYKGSTGYVIKCQELIFNDPGKKCHILAVGITGYLPEPDDPLDAIDAIHRLGGLAIVAHPGVVQTKHGMMPFRRITTEEERYVLELIRKADGVETFNPMLVNILPYLAWLNSANDLAKRIAEEEDRFGIAASDTHIALWQIYRASIALPRVDIGSGDINWEQLKEIIASGKYATVEHYLDTLSFIRAHSEFIQREAYKDLLRLVTAPVRLTREAVNYLLDSYLLGYSLWQNSEVNHSGTNQRKLKKIERKERSYPVERRYQGGRFMH